MESQPRRRGRPAGKRSKTAWDAVRRRTRPAWAADRGCSDAASPDELHDDTETGTLAQSDASMEVADSWFGALRAKMRLIAAAFWSSDYTPIFDAEMVDNERECGGEAAVLAPTSYRCRLKGAAAERYDRRRRNQKRDEMAIRLHSNNQQHWSPSLLARSITYYGKVSRFVQQNEGAQRRIASKPTVWRFLQQMKELRCAGQRCV